MTSEWKTKLLVYLESEVHKARRNAAETDLASQFVVTGPSQSGDKYHSVKAAELTEKYLANLLNLKKEIENEPVKAVDAAKPICFVGIAYTDGGILTFTYVNKAVSLTQFLFVSKDSPLGRAILGKKAGDDFSYSLDEGMGNKLFKGTITKLE
jgi:transcription elongation GreA/GreB family factor